MGGLETALLQNKKYKQKTARLQKLAKAQPKLKLALKLLTVPRNALAFFFRDIETTLLSGFIASFIGVMTTLVYCAPLVSAPAAVPLLPFVPFIAAPALFIGLPIAACCAVNAVYGRINKSFMKNTAYLQKMPDHVARLEQQRQHIKAELALAIGRKVQTAQVKVAQQTQQESELATAVAARRARIIQAVRRAVNEYAALTVSPLRRDDEIHVPDPDSADNARTNFFSARIINVAPYQDGKQRIAMRVRNRGVYVKDSEHCAVPLNEVEQIIWGAGRGHERLWLPQTVRLPALEQLQSQQKAGASATTEPARPEVGSAVLVADYQI